MNRSDLTALLLLVLPAWLGAQTAVTEAVQYSRAGGIIRGEVVLEVAPPQTPGGVVRYTVDNSVPTAASPAWTEALAISENAVVRARIFAPGLAPGPVVSRGFLRLDATLDNYLGWQRPFFSTLPLVVVGTFGGDIEHSRDYLFTYVVVVDRNAVGRARLGATPAYEGRGAMHLRGNTSSGYDQRSLTWETRDDADEDADVSLLGMPEESDWVLYAPYLDKTLMRNPLAYSRMIEYRGAGSAMRTQPCEVFINRGATSRVGMADYRGVYVLTEKIKRDKNRVAVAKLAATDTDPTKITGGYIFRRDKTDDEYAFTTARQGVEIQVVEPDPPNPEQAAYLEGYLNGFEEALAGPGFADPVTGYAAFIEPESFVDNQWFVEITKQMDGYRYSSYFSKDRGGRVRALPLWDYDISLGNADYRTGEKAEGWYYEQLTPQEYAWYPRLHEDPAYERLYWDRYWRLRRGVFATGPFVREVARRRAELMGAWTEPVTNRTPLAVQSPAARHFRQWPILGRYVWPNAPGYEHRTTYQSEVARLVRFATRRLSWIDRQNAVEGVLYHPPRLSRASGVVRPGAAVAIRRAQGVLPNGLRFAGGTIYFTTDGSDPRGSDGQPHGTVYTGALRIEATQTVKARLHDGERWTPLAEETYTVEPAAN